MLVSAADLDELGTSDLLVLRESAQLDGRQQLEVALHRAAERPHHADRSDASVLVEEQTEGPAESRHDHFLVLERQDAPRLLLDVAVFELADGVRVSKLAELGLAPGKHLPAQVPEHRVFDRAADSFDSDALLRGAYVGQVHDERVVHVHVAVLVARSRQQLVGQDVTDAVACSHVSGLVDFLRAAVLSALLEATLPL